MPSTTTLRAMRRTGLAVAGLAWLAACDRGPTQPPTLERVATSDITLRGSLFPAPDPSGTIATYIASGGFDLGNPFFKSLGTNGRSCASCHVLENGFGLSAQHVRAVFAVSGGRDPLFAPVDGANCPTEQRRGPEAHSLLINNGLIRVTVTVPPHTAEFTLSTVHDPYHCALSTDSQGTTVAVYRRPLPTTNLGFLSAVMFDGRETVVPLNNPSTFSANLQTDLAHQAVDATLGHAQASQAPSTAQVSAIVDFERGLITAQSSDDAAGLLSDDGAQGGPVQLAGEPYYPGINDPLGGNPLGTPFDPASMTIFKRWLTVTGRGAQTQARQSVARGEELFGSRPIQITNVTGLNDALGLPIITGTCSTCHDTPNVGDHSLPLPLDIGTSHSRRYERDPQIQAALGQLSAPDLPVYQVSCGTGVLFTSDPGRALITGKCADVGRVKGPILRGLASRAPYFHNGSAASLDEVVAFYNQRFQMGLTRQQQADLVAFLKSL